MSSQQATIDFLLEQLSAAGVVTARKMFGEYGVYCDGVIVAFVCDDQLFLKPTVTGRAFIGTPEEAPPYPGAKLYFLITADLWDDREWLSALVKKTKDELAATTKKKK